MNPSSVGSVSVDRCAGCGVLWLDAGELAAFRQGLERGSGYPRGVHLAWKPGREPAQTACPRCPDVLLTHGRVGRTRMQRCPSCYGVLISRTELAHFERGVGDRAGRIRLLESIGARLRDLLLSIGFGGRGDDRSRRS